MGEVYRAKDTRLERIVALKVLAPRFAADQQFRERFEREAKTLSHLNHPHVCTLYDVGHAADTAFLVMDTSMARRSRLGWRIAPDSRRAVFR